MTKAHIAQIVLEALRERQAEVGDSQFFVSPDEIRDKDGMLWVMVDVVPWVKKMGRLDDVLDEVQELMENKHHLNVLLVPSPAGNKAMAQKVS